MKYDPIEIEQGKDCINFYFIRGGHKHWFYEVYDVRNENELKEWDRHLSRKLWYTDEIREKALNLMSKLYER